jgi:hypothetical protein
MLSLNDVINLVGDEFLDGNTAIAGIAIYILAIVVVLGLTRKPFFALIVGMAVTMIFTAMGVLPTELAILMIIVSVLGLAFTARRVMD